MVAKVARRHLDELIGEVAGRQRGLIRHDQLLELGLGRRAVTKRQERGRLIAVRRGVYAVGHAALGREAHWLAAVWSCGPEAVLSHSSSAALLGLSRSSGSAIHVTTPTRNGHRPRPRIRLHRIPLAEGERTLRDGIPATTWARTVLDLAAMRPRRDVELALERAEQLRTFDLGALERTLHGSPGRPGCAALRAVLAEMRPGTTATRSELEEAMLGLCRRFALPEPVVNARVAGYEVDFLWREQRLIAETDGWQSHGTRRGFEADRRRDAELMLMGFRVARFTYQPVLGAAGEVAAILGGLLRSIT